MPARRNLFAVAVLTAALAGCGGNFGGTAHRTAAATPTTTGPDGTVRTTKLPAGHATIQDLSRAAADSCTAIAAEPAPIQGDTPTPPPRPGPPDQTSAKVWHWDGRRWSGPDQLGGVVTAPLTVHVSCPTVSACTALVDATGPDTTTAYRWDGTTWRRGATLRAGVSGLSCPTTSFCMVMGDQQAWTLEGSRFSQAMAIPDVFAVSCVSPAACYSSGLGVYAVWDGTRWRTLPGPSEVVEVAASCASPQFCMTVGPGVQYGGVISNGAAIVWDGQPGSAGRVVPVPGQPSDETSLAAVSCPTSGQCYLEDTASRIHRYRDGAWGRDVVSLPTSTTSRAVGPMSCPTTAFCAAVIGDDEVANVALTGG